MRIGLLLGIVSTIIYSQTLDVTFRYINDPGEEFVRIFVPGTMPDGDTDDWGPNSGGVINANAPSLMEFDASIDAYKRTYSVNLGDEHHYKFHFHFNQSGTDWQWIPDPLNPIMTTDGWENSILEVSDPLFFQPVRHIDANGMVNGLSVGLFTNDTINAIQYIVGTDTLDGANQLSSDNIFYAGFNPPISIYEAFQVSASIGGTNYVVLDYPSVTVVEEPLPEGLGLGPNYVNGQMTLVVYAPHQPVMQVIVTEPGGTGNSSDALVMKKATGEEDIWWVELDLPNGEYEYEYLLMDGNRIPDPFTRRLTNGKSRIEIGGGGISTADDYEWQSDDYVRPSLDTLIIYEMHVDDFSAQGSGNGTHSDVINRLDYLKSTGINAIELMPITEFPGDRSWGYNPEIMSAVEGSYGTPETFKMLVDEAHSRGIAVILDLVWNHATSSTPIWQIQPSQELNPYFKNHNNLNPNETEGTWGMLDFDHFNLKTIEYINEVHRIWLEEYRIDGFRFDATRYVGWDMDQPQYGLPAWTSAITEMDPTAYQMAEHLPSEPWLIENTDLTSSWHDSFHDRLIDHIFSSIGTMTAMRQIIGLYEYSNWGTPYADLTQAVKYMVSHDEQSLIQEMVEFDGVSLSQAREIDKFYASLLFTAQGIPMIWQGQEFGFQSGWLDNNGNGNWNEEKLGYRPVDWSLLNTEEGQSHLDHYSRLARFRKMNPAFSKGEFYDLWRYSNERVIVYGYKDESEGNSDDQVVVIANFSSSDQTVYDVPFLSGGNWYNVTEPGNNLYTADGNYGECSVPSYSAVIYSKNQYELGMETPSFIPEKFQTLSAYPNPFNPSITIQIELKNPIQTNMNVEVNIYDINGRFIQTLLENSIESGVHRIEWRPQNISSGIYIVSLQTEIGIKNQKVLYLK